MALPPNELEEFLTSSGYIDDVYEAMQDDDLARAPMAVLDILKKTNIPPVYIKIFKSAKMSSAIREGGNTHFNRGNFVEALRLYNLALVTAPNNSRDLMLAYSNRSALLYTINEYKACLKDIDTCFELDASCNAVKLNKRKRNCIRNMQRNEGGLLIPTEDIFKLRRNVNSDIPCATTDIEVRFDNGVPKVIAKKNIEIGTVVAIETAYVGVLNRSSHGITCSHCHRMSKNLMPCPNCSYALFCNEECRKECMDDVHRTECYFMNNNDNDNDNNVFQSRLVFKTFLKIKQHSASWRDFIKLSNNIGNVKVNSSSCKEVYNTNDTFSILNFKEKTEPKFGPMFNFSYICALYIQFLLTAPNFFPENPAERKAAVEAVARLMMKLYFHIDPLEVTNFFKGRNVEVAAISDPNHAFFTVIGQLPHKCEANLLTIGMGNAMAIVAITQIAKGSELTISYVEHTYEIIENNAKTRSIELYRRSMSCECHVCRDSKVVQHLNSQERKLYQDWDMLCRVANVPVHTKHIITINTLKTLRNVPYSVEFSNVYQKVFGICRRWETKLLPLLNKTVPVSITPATHFLLKMMINEMLDDVSHIFY